MSEGSNLIIGTDNLYTYMKEVEEGGKYKANIYACSSGVPTIGVGFALLVKSRKEWSIRKDLFSKNGILDKAGVTLPTEIDIKKISKILLNVIGKLNNNDKKAAKKLVKDNSTTLNKLTINEAQSKELFKILQAEYEGYLINRIVLKGKVTKDKAKKIIKALSADEQIALYSCVYNALTVIGPSLSKALKSYTKDGVSEKDKAYYKTEAWYEIRYNSHITGWDYIIKKATKPATKKASGDNGLANRRYKDSLKFGLYGLSNGKQNNLSQNTKDGILKFLNSKEGRDGEKVTETIKKYEKEFSPSATTLGTKKQDKIEKILERLKQKEVDPVEEIKAEVQEKGRVLDNLSESFLKEYNQKYGLVLDKQEPIYNSITKIQEHNDVLIFPLMDRIVVSMEMEAEKEKNRDKDLYKSIKEFINRCKETLEVVINNLGGYERTAYKQDNNKDLTDLDRKKRLIENFKTKRFNCPDTKKSHKFFESFMTKEDKKKEETKKEAEEKKQREEEQKKKEAEQEKNKERYAQESQKKREEEREQARMGEGWIIVRENGEVKYMNRKEYYGV